MVLDGVVRASREKAGDGSPLISMCTMSLEDDGILSRSERSVLYRGAELITPPKAARFTRSSRDARADEGPITRAVLLHKLN